MSNPVVIKTTNCPFVTPPLASFTTSMASQVQTVLTSLPWSYIWCCHQVWLKGLKWSVQLPSQVLERKQFALQFYSFSPWTGILASQIFPRGQRDYPHKWQNNKREGIWVPSCPNWEKSILKNQGAWHFNYEYANPKKYFILLKLLLFFLC